MRREAITQFVRFALVGVAVALTYVCLYLALRQAGVAQVWANGLAFAQAIVLQYACQAAFTFHRPLNDRAQMVRFAGMISLGFMSSAMITGPIAVAFAIPDWKAAFAVTFLLPIQNYVLMTLWVFAAPASDTDIPS
ncbi:MAG: GtrA family protein [Pseudomonadota bacterium]